MPAKLPHRTSSTSVVVYKSGVLEHFAPPWGILGLESIRTFSAEGKKLLKIVKIHKDFELEQVFMYNFLC